MSQKDLASLKGLLDDPSFADVLAEGPGKFASRITKYFRDNPRPGPNSDTEQATAFLERVLQCLDEGGEDDMSAFTSNHQDNKREDRESLNEIKAKAGREGLARGDHPPRDDERGDHLGRAARVDVNLAHRKVGDPFGRARGGERRGQRWRWRRCE